MVNHLYLLGETVALSRPGGSFLKQPNSYTVRAQLPPLGDELQYRIKSLYEPFERVVLEHELARVAQQQLPEFARSQTSQVA